MYKIRIYEPSLQRTYQLKGWFCKIKKHDDGTETIVASRYGAEARIFSSLGSAKRMEATLNMKARGALSFQIIEEGYEKEG